MFVRGCKTIGLCYSNRVTLSQRLCFRWIGCAAENEEIDNAPEQDTSPKIVAGYDIEQETLLDSPLFANLLKVTPPRKLQPI